MGVHRRESRILLELDLPFKNTFPKGYFFSFHLPLFLILTFSLSGITLITLLIGSCNVLLSQRRRPSDPQFCSLSFLIELLSVLAEE